MYYCIYIFKPFDFKSKDLTPRIIGNWDTGRGQIVEFHADGIGLTYFSGGSRTSNNAINYHFEVDSDDDEIHFIHYKDTEKEEVVTCKIIELDANALTIIGTKEEADTMYLQRLNMQDQQDK